MVLLIVALIAIIFFDAILARLFKLRTSPR